MENQYAKNVWKKVGGFQTERFRAASVAVNNKMIVLGGRDVDGLDIIGFEVNQLRVHYSMHHSVNILQ